MSYLEELLPEFRKEARIRLSHFTQCRPILKEEVNFYENEYLRRKWRLDSRCG